MPMQSTRNHQGVITIILIHIYCTTTHARKISNPKLPDPIQGDYIPKGDAEETSNPQTKDAQQINLTGIAHLLSQN